MRKLIVALLMLGMCGVAKGTCQVEAVVPGSQQAVNQPNVLSGSSFIPNSQQVNGGGVGPWVTGPTYQVNPQFNFDWQNISGDVTVVAQLTKASWVGAGQNTGINVWEPRGITGSNVGMHFIWNNGWVATLEQSIVSQGGAYRTSTVLAQQALTSGYYLKFVKTSGSGGFANFSGYYSTDGVSYVLLGTANGVILDGNMGYGMYSSSGDTTHILSATWQNISGLMLTSLTDIDVNTSVPGSSYAAGSASAGVQPGQLFIGPNPISGEALVFNCGTSGNNLQVGGQFTLTDLTTNQIIAQPSAQFVPTVPNCNSSCTYSYLLQQPQTSGSFGPFTLVAGHQYSIQNFATLQIAPKTTTNVLGTPIYINP